MVLKPIAHHPGQVNGVQGAGISLHVHHSQSPYLVQHNIQPSAFHQPPTTMDNNNTVEYIVVDETDDGAAGADTTAAMYTFPQPSSDQDSSQSDQSSSDSSPNSNRST